MLVAEKTYKCSRCGEIKPSSEFYKNQHESRGVHCYCNPCRAAYQRAYRAKKAAMNGRRKTGALGMRNASAKLDESDVVLIRALQKEGLKQSVIAEKFEVSTDTVRNVLKGYTWRHVP